MVHKLKNTIVTKKQRFATVWGWVGKVTTWDGVKGGEEQFRFKIESGHCRSKRVVSERSSLSGYEK